MVSKVHIRNGDEKLGFPYKSAVNLLGLYLVFLTFSNQLNYISNLIYEEQSLPPIDLVNHDSSTGLTAERKFRPPAPVATQQQLVTTSDNGTSDIQEDEASKNEEGKKVTSADSEAQGEAQNDTNSRDKLEAETGMEKEKSLSQNKNEKLISENQVPLEELEMDEEGFLAGSFDDYQDGNPQQNKSSRSTLENFETAGSDFSDQKSNVSSIAPTSDTAGGFLSVGNFVASEDSKPVVQEGVGEPGISSESNNVNDSISGTAGVSRIVVPELADGSRVIEIVLLSPEGNKPSKGQTASDTADSEYDNEHRQNGLQFSTEGVNVSENASAPTVKGLEVDNHISSTAAPETENRSFKENQPDISEAVVENSPQQTEFRNYKFQDLEAEKASMMNSTEDHVDKEFDGETTETNTSEAAQGGASSTWMYSSLYVPAPLSPSGATQVHSGKVVVPAVVEQAQEHALKALQSLEVWLLHFVLTLSEFLIVYVPELIMHGPSSASPLMLTS